MEDNILNTGGVSLVNKFSNLNEEEIKNKLTESKFKIQKKSKKKFFSFKNLKTNSLKIYLISFAIVLFGFFIALLIYIIKNDKAYIELDYLKVMVKPYIYKDYEYKLFKLKDNDLDILLIKDEKTLVASISVAINIGYKTFNKSNNSYTNNNSNNDNINEDLGYSNLLKNYLIFTFPSKAKKKLDLFNGTITATIEDYYTIFNLNILNSEFYNILPYFAKLFTYSEKEFINLYDENDKSISNVLDNSTESDYYQVAYDKKKLDKRFINFFIYNETFYDKNINMYENLDYEGINKNKYIYNKSNIKNLYDFYKKYYTSNNMKVVIYSYYKMNKLIENCVHYFKNIKNSNFEFSYEINFMNNDNNPKFFSFEKKTRCNTIKIFFTIESNNTQNYADNYNNLNYFDYFIKKNSHNDNCTLLYKLLENGVFEIETEIYEEINDIIIYKIELSIEDNNKDEIDKKNITEILDKVFDFVDYYSKYFNSTLFEKLTEFYNNAFYYIDKQDQYDFLTNFAARELFFKKENFSNFLNYKYLTKYTNFEIIKNDLSNINILISKNYSYNDSTFNYAYTYKVNELNFTYNKTNEKKDDNYCNFSINISENYIDNKNNNLKKSFIKDCHNSKDFSTPIMYYFSNNEIEIPKVSYILYIFNYYSKICDDEYRLSYFLYYIQIKTLILENLFDYIEAGSTIEINTNELGIYVYIESFNYYISDIIQKIFLILYEDEDEDEDEIKNKKGFNPENNSEKNFYINKLKKEIDLYNLEDPSLLNQDYFHIAMKKSPIMKYNLNFDIDFEKSYKLIKDSLGNVLTNGLLYGNIDYNSAEEIYKETTKRYEEEFKFLINNNISNFKNTYKFLQNVQDIKNFSDTNNTNNTYNIIYIISDKRVTTSFSNYYYLGEWTRENDVKADLTVSILKNYLKVNLREYISQKNDLKVSKIIFSKQIFLDVTVTPIKMHKFNYDVLNKRIDDAFENFSVNFENDYKKKKEIDIADNYYFLIRSLSNFMTLKEDNIKQKAISLWMTYFMSNRTKNNDTSQPKEEDVVIDYENIKNMRKQFDSDIIEEFLEDQISDNLIKLTLIFIDTKLKFQDNSNFTSTILGNQYKTAFKNESELLKVYVNQNET